MSVIPDTPNTTSGLIAVTTKVELQVAYRHQPAISNPALCPIGLCCLHIPGVHFSKWVIYQACAALLNMHICSRSARARFLFPLLDYRSWNTIARQWVSTGAFLISSPLTYLFICLFVCLSVEREMKFIGRCGGPVTLSGLPVCGP